MTLSNNLSEAEKDLFEVKKFWMEAVPSYYYDYIQDDIEVLKILANKEIIDAVKRLPRGVREKAAPALYEAAYYVRNATAIIEICRIVSRCGSNVASEVTWGLGRAARCVRDTNAIIEICRIVGKCEGEFAGIAADRLGWIAYYMGDPNVVINICRMMDKYRDEVIALLADDLYGMHYILRSNDELRNAIIEISKVFSSDEIAEIVNRHKGETLRDIIVRLRNFAFWFNDTKNAIRVARMLDKNGIFKVIDWYELDHMLYQIINEDLDHLIKDRESLETVVTYIKSGKRLPKPDENNIKDYPRVAIEYAKSKYDLTKDITMDQLLMLLAIKDDNRIREAVDIVNKAKESNVKYYSFEKTEIKELHYSIEELFRYSVIAVVGSRDKYKEKQAVDAIAKIVGEKAVNKARNEFYTKYKHLLKDVIAAMPDYKRAWDILRQTNSEAIVDVLNAVHYKDVNISSARFVKAVESKNPLDYDSRVQLVCVYLPGGKGVLKYCMDERFMLVRYDIGGETLGSAICYIEGDIMLVDSVEGHRRFRNKKIFEIVYNDLIERAKERKVKMVVFNKNVGNETPRRFIEHIGRKGLEAKKVGMKLDTEGYLEAGKAGNEVDGYVVNLMDCSTN